MTEKEKEELDQLLEKIDEFLKLAKKGAPLVTIDTFPIRKRDVKIFPHTDFLKRDAGLSTLPPVILLLKEKDTATV